MELSEYYQIIEEAISDLGVEPETARTESPGIWTLAYKKTSFLVSILTLQDGKSYFKCMCSVSKIPKENISDFFSEVLEIGHQMPAACLTRFQDLIYLSEGRQVEGLDKIEIVASIGRIGKNGDNLYTYFENKYFAGNFDNKM